MKKRMVSLLLAVALILSVCPAAVFQANAAANDTIFAVENAWAAADSTVKVNILVENNTGITYTGLNVSWGEGLTLIDDENGSVFGDLTYQYPSRYNQNGTNFIWYGSLMESIQDGVILTLTFQVAEDVEDSAMLKINISGSSFVDNDAEAFIPVFINGGVRIVNYTPGDINDDNTVNGKDLIQYARYASDGFVTDPDGYNVVLNENAADVNDDGKRNGQDLIMISRYISDGSVTDPNGYNIILKPVTPRCNHSNMETVEFKAATCTEDGNISYYYCDDCGRYFNDAVGSLELAYEQTILQSPGHDVIIDQAVAPTYTTTGLTEGSHCGSCGEVFVEQETVPVLQANYHSITYRNLNGAESPEPSSYAQHTGLMDMPEPEVPGYIFKGWYTASEGGTVVDYIPAGSTQDYILYARWDLVTYKITYFEAPNYEGEINYTVEDEIYLADPNWPGLGFTGWTEQSNKISTEVKEGKTYYKIEPGTTGDLKLTAKWKLMRNIATPGTNRKMLAEYDEATKRYTFIYELGTIENVVLEQMSSNLLYQHTGAGDFTLTMASENTLEESIADSITRTISKSVSSSSEWETSKDWAKENSVENSFESSISAEIGSEAVNFKAIISAGYGYANSSTSSWGGSESKGGSYGEETESGEEVGSSFSYLTSLTTSSETSVTITADAPIGYYDYVQAGNIRVFGVVTYVPGNVAGEEGNYYLNTYSILDNMHGVVLYYPTVNDLNNPTCETLQYNMPRENIQEIVDNSYFVQYDANGGEGNMNVSLHTKGGTEKLIKNTFTKNGYVFIGWETRDSEGLSTGTYTDEQIINTTLAENGVTVTMYALWEKADYSIKYEGNKPTLGSTYVDNLPADTTCKYDEDVTLAAAPTLAGYTFGGWYYDSICAEKAGDAGEVLTKANLVNQHGGSIKLYAKWTPNTYKLIYNANGGTASAADTTVTFDSLYQATATATRDGHDFMGWYLPDGTKVDGTNYWRYAEDTEVTAKWLKNTHTFVLRQGYKNSDHRVDNENLITDSDPLYEYFDPEMDRQALIDQGYTQLKITFHVWLYEKHDGDKDIWLKPYYDKTGKEMGLLNFTSTKGKWNEHDELKYELQNITNSGFNDSCAFWLMYDCHGNQDDDWYIGDTWVTIQAIK